MAQPAMDALGAFSFLADNLPIWVDRASDLATHSTAKHAEYTAAFKKLSTKARPRPRRRKNSSVCSVHSDDQEEALASLRKDHDNNKNDNDNTEAVVDDDDNNINNDAFMQEAPYDNPRKRGPDDQALSVSSDENPDLLCMRHNVVIDYDGHTQECLEGLVRGIDSARNNLRRGKMASLRPNLRMGMMRTGARSGGTGAGGGAPSGSPSRPGEDGDGPEALLSSIRSARGGRGLQSGLPFDMAEKQLGMMHSLCETAAHQALRVGHCNPELDSLKEKFTGLQKMVNAEVQRLKRQQEQQQQQQQQQQETERVVEKPATPEPNKTTAGEELAETGTKRNDKNAIEVDDDTAESDEYIDVTAFRSSRMMRS